MTLLLFCAIAVAIVFLWNRAYRNIPWPVAIAFLVLTIAYEAPTLFTSRVDLPGRLAYVAYPWKALGGEPVKANTGIVFTQLAPWTEAARASLRKGALPEWNRNSASGTPLLANQQTALLHPFTLAGLVLSTGKAFTLSACLRLFTVLIFTFVFLRRWRLCTAAACYGAVAYAFCTFHIVWLLFPLGLATMMLPLLLAGVDELSRRLDAIGALPLILGTTFALFGGHPESAAWVMVVAGLYVLYIALRLRRRMRFVIAAALAFAIGIAMAAVFWYPTWRILPHTSRAQLIEALKKYPPVHKYSADWLLPLVAPNILGTPPAGTYTAPKPFNPGVLDDYGEVASGYAGVISIGLAIAAVMRMRIRPRPFLIILLLLAFVTMIEPPYWRDLVRHTPLIGLTLLGRLRFVIALTIAMLAACGLDDWLRGRTKIVVLAACMLIAAIVVGGAYGSRHVYAWHIAVAIGAIVLLHFRTSVAAIAMALLTFGELAYVTRGYNPAARAADVYPSTGAIRVLEKVSPARFVAVGWSFLAETPSFYGIEDLKTTDPIANGRYLRVMGPLLQMRPGDYDQIVNDLTTPFLNFLGVQYIYVPADSDKSAPHLTTLYSGADGRVLRNPNALPRYFSVNDVVVEPDLDAAIARMQQMTDFRHSAIIDAAPGITEKQFYAPPAEVSIRKYGPSSAELHVKSEGRALIVTSDVAWPGWSARWNGRELPTVTANGAFVGVFVPTGEGTLRLSYSAPGLRAGAIASLLATALLGFALMRARSRGAQ
jgi:hypothetical protein